MELMEVLGSRQRLKILRALAGGDRYLSELAKEVKADTKALQRHLAILEKAGLIESYVEGRRRYYRLVKRITLDVSPKEGERRFIIAVRPV